MSPTSVPALSYSTTGWHTDRHPKNISFQALREPHRSNVFDHSHALFREADCPEFHRRKLQLGRVCKVG